MGRAQGLHPSHDQLILALRAAGSLEWKDVSQILRLSEPESREYVSHCRHLQANDESIRYVYAFSQPCTNQTELCILLRNSFPFGIAYSDLCGCYPHIMNDVDLLIHERKCIRIASDKKDWLVFWMDVRPRANDRVIQLLEQAT